MFYLCLILILLGVIIYFLKNISTSLSDLLVDLGDLHTDVHFISYKLNSQLCNDDSFEYKDVKFEVEETSEEGE